jgi:hypothetical protein
VHWRIVVTRGSPKSIGIRLQWLHDNGQWLTLSKISTAPRLVRAIVNALRDGAPSQGATLTIVNAHLLDPVRAEADAGAVIDKHVRTATADERLEREWAERFANTPKMPARRRGHDVWNADDDE